MRSLRRPSRGMSEAKGEQESTETLSFRCDCERCRFMRGRIVALLLKMTWFYLRKEPSILSPYRLIVLSPSHSLINLFTNLLLHIFLQNFTCLKIMETHAGSMISWLKFHKPCHGGIFGMIDFAKAP